MTGKSIRILTVILAFLGVLFVFQPAALADAVTMDLTNVYNPNNVMGGVYDSPYVATITDGTQKTQALIICDDFETDIPVPYSWNALSYALSAGGTGVTKFSTTPTPAWTDDNFTLTIQDEYAAAALLAEELLANLNSPTASNSSLVGQYSYAIWTIFDPSAINGYNNQLAGDTTDQNAINTLRTTAFYDVLHTIQPYPNETVSIYTPTPSTASQEFLVVSTPEASSLANLAVDLLLLAGVVFVVRRRRLTSGLSN